MPFTKEQIEELPKGFTASKTLGRKFRRALLSGKKQVSVIGGKFMGITDTPKPNCRKHNASRKHREAYYNMHSFKTNKSVDSEVEIEEEVIHE